MYRNVFLHSVIALAIILFMTPLCYADKQPVKLIKQWQGSVTDETLMNDAPTYITTDEELARLWGNWGIAGEKPEIDFSKEIVVLVTSRGSVLRLIATLDEKGDLSVNGLGTMDLGPGFRYVIATVSREGVETINGKDLPTPIDSQNMTTITGTVTCRKRIAMPPRGHF